jgi:hypothetical protein
MFDFTFETKITKEFLLQQNNEETYMAYYLGFPVDKKLHISPLRQDNKPTCAFFKGKSGILYFKDFATNACLDFVNVVMTKFSCTYHQALKIIAEDFGYIKSKTPKTVTIQPQPKFEETKQTFIQVEVKEFDKHELKWWESYGITKDILKKFNIFSCKTVFLNGRVFAQSSQHSPIYGYYFGKKEGIEQWRIYFPKNQKTGYKFIGNVNMKTIQGFRQLPKEGKVLVITKSMKDLMVFYSLGIPAIAPNSENIFISDKVLEDLKKRFKHIFLLFDNDLPGVRFTNKIRKKYPELIVTLIPRNSGAKDLSDYYFAFGRDKTLKLIKSFIEKWQKRVS